MQTQKWVFHLYVSSHSPKTRAAVQNIQKLCDEYLPGRHELHVIDVLQNPEHAEADRVLAVPMLVRKIPGPVRRLIGDFSSRETVLTALDLGPKY